MDKSIINHKVSTELILTIQDVLGVDIREKTRKTQHVYARMIYYKILRKLGYSFMSIGNTLNKHHATVIHSIKTFDDLYQVDENMFNQFELVKKVYFKEIDEHPFFHKTHSSLLNEAFSLEKENKSLTLFIIHLKNSLNQQEKYKKIISQLAERSLKEEQIEYVSKKLNHILNGI